MATPTKLRILLPLPPEGEEGLSGKMARKNHHRRLWPILDRLALCLLTPEAQDASQALERRPQQRRIMKSDERSIRELVETWLDASKRDDFEIVLSLMDDDAVFMVPAKSLSERKAGANG